MGVPFPVIATVLISIVLDFLLKNWISLNRAFLVGANPDYAELLGINVKRTVFLGFALCGSFLRDIRNFHVFQIGDGVCSVWTGN